MCTMLPALVPPALTPLQERSTKASRPRASRLARAHRVLCDRAEQSVKVVRWRAERTLDRHAIAVRGDGLDRSRRNAAHVAIR